MNTRNGVRMLTVAATLVVMAVLVVGLIAIGSPGLQRKRKLDHRRVEDLISISRQLNTYWDESKELPPSLAVLAVQPGLSDPSTGQPYEYKVIGTNTYRLCAVFALDSQNQSQKQYYFGADDWLHGVGRRCFERKAKQKSID